MIPNWGEHLPELMSAAIDGELDVASAEQLDKILDENPEALAIYVDLMTVHAALRWRAGADLIEKIGAAGDADAKDEKPPAASPAVKSPVLGFLGGVMDYASHSRTLMFWLVAGALGLYFAVQLGSLLVSRFWAQNAVQVADDRGDGTANRGQPSDHPGLSADGKIVARLTNAVDCRWTFSHAAGTNHIDQPESVAPDIGAELRAGQKLNLAAGLAELTFDSGAKVILHAPAQFEVADALGGGLARGKLTAKVPHAAAGFTIATPGGKVVDLGTEFGVKVRDDGVMNVIVYVGEVKVESGAGGPDQVKVVHLKAGQAVTIGPDHIAKAIRPEDERFIRDLAPLGEKPMAEAAYVQFMKSLKPVVWFRMEGKDSDRLLHDEIGGPDAKLSWDGPGNPFVKGPIGKSLWLRGEMLKDYAIVPDYPKAEHGKLTVTAWAYAVNRANFASILKNWNFTGQGQFEFGLRPQNERRSDEGREGNDLTIKIADAAGRDVLLREGESHPFPVNQWQHVAFVTDGSTLRLYRQGREVGAMRHSGLLFPVQIRALGIGVKTNVAGDAPDPDKPAFWDGKLDEIAIFNDALSAEVIKKLAGAAPR